MSSFSDYVKEKYPTYYRQKTLVEKRTKQSAANDLGAGNIEKSLSYESNFRKNLNMQTIEEKLIGNRRRLTSRVKIYESDSLLMSKAKHHKDLERSFYVTFNNNENEKYSMHNSKKETYKNPELAGYDLDEFKTSPPVGWKRPASRATILAKMLVNGRKEDTISPNLASSKTIKQQKKNRMDKEIYLEAIYREDIAGQIFMKYLINKKKLVKRTIFLNFLK